MHGRPRNPAKQEDDVASAAKASKLRSLQSQFLHFHHNSIYDQEALDVSAKLVELNPEYYSAWNYRKLAVNHLLSQPDSDPVTVLNHELFIAENALKRNFKSSGPGIIVDGFLKRGTRLMLLSLKISDEFYGAWHQRN